MPLRAGQRVGAVNHAGPTHRAGFRLGLSDTSALTVLSDTVSRHLLQMRLFLCPTGATRGFRLFVSRYARIRFPHVTLS